MQRLPLYAEDRVKGKRSATRRAVHATAVWRKSPIHQFTNSYCAVSPGFNTSTSMPIDSTSFFNWSGEPVSTGKVP